MAMASLSRFNSNCLCYCRVSPSPTLPNTARASFALPPKHVIPALRFAGGDARRVTVVAKAGAPGSSTYLFAFLFPFSLLVVTIFASIRIADKLDRDFLEELAINQATREADQEEDPDTTLEEEPVVPRSRNRPKREA